MKSSPTKAYVLYRTYPGECVVFYGIMYDEELVDKKAISLNCEIDEVDILNKEE